MKRTEQTNQILDELHNYFIDVEKRQIYLNGIENADSPALITPEIANKFVRNFLFLQNQSSDKIVIHINSDGGDFMSGMMIYDVIKNSPCQVIIICHGYCMSTATIILQAADERIAMPNTLFMIHEGEQNVSGTHKQANSWLATMQVLKQKMMNIYVERCSKGAHFTSKQSNKNKIKSYLSTTINRKEDWYMTAEEALNYGFIDTILGTKYKDLNKIVS